MPTKDELREQVKREALPKGFQPAVQMPEEKRRWWERLYKITKAIGPRLAERLNKRIK